MEHEAKVIYSFKNRTRIKLINKMIGADFNIERLPLLFIRVNPNNPCHPRSIKL